MDELLERLTANGFAELEGLAVRGTLPVRQDLVNELLTTLLQNAQAGSTSSAAKPTAPAVNWMKLVTRLQVQLQDGKAVVDFELRR